MGKSIYEELGVDASKASVRRTFESVVDNEYPGAFVNIITDPYCPTRAVTMHQDGDGSKFVQRMLHYLEDGDGSVFDGMVDDALAMNTGDIAAAGFVSGPWLLTDVLNLNMEPGLKSVVMAAVARRMSELLELYRSFGFSIKFLGGETADLRHQVRSGVFDVGITAFEEKNNLIAGNVEPGDIIFGFQSDGQAAWETRPNSGIMSNGLTMARSALMSREYNTKYPQLRGEDPCYSGRFLYNQPLWSGNKMTAGEALISPTRQWPIVVKELISQLEKRQALPMLHGISMNTGGGCTKIGHVGQGIAYLKAMTPSSIADIFYLLAEESEESWENMFQTFNCGVGIDIVGKNDPAFISALEAASETTMVNFFELGACEPSKKGKENEVVIFSDYGTFSY